MLKILLIPLLKNKRGLIIEIDIFEDKENKVFNRREIKFYVEYEGEATPKITDIKSKLVALLNSKKESTVVDNVQPHYGEPKALGYAKVYETVEDLEKTQFVLVVLTVYLWLIMVIDTHAVNVDTLK